MNTICYLLAINMQYLHPAFDHHVNGLKHQNVTYKKDEEKYQNLQHLAF